MEQNIFKEINDALENASDHIINLEQEVDSLKKRESLSKKDVEDIIKNHKNNGISVAAFTGNQSNNSSLTGTPTEVVYFDALGNPTSDSLFTSNATTKARVAARTTTQVDTPVEFDGTGVDDLTVDYSGSTAAEPVGYTVTISAGDPTSPNKFSWVDTDGNSGTNVTILPGLAQTLSYGIDITFASGTGHDTNDNWTFGILPSAETGFYNNDDIIGFGLSGSGNKVTASNGAFAYGGTLVADYNLVSGNVYFDGTYFTSALASKGDYSINVNLPGGINSSLGLRDGIARLVANDGSQSTLQLDGNGLFINDAFYMPLADGSAGQALLTDGAGQAYWGSAGGTPALTNSYIGFGSGSNLLTGSSAFTFDSSTNTVSLGSIGLDSAILLIGGDGRNLQIYNESLITSIGIFPSSNIDGKSLSIFSGIGNGTDKLGGDISISTGRQTGNAVAPYFNFSNTRKSVVTGSSLADLEVFFQNHDGVTTTYSETVQRHIVPKSVNTTDNTQTNLFKVTLPDGGMTAGFFTFAVTATDGTDVQSRSEHVTYSAVNKGGSYTTQIVGANDAQAHSSGTLSTSWGITGGTNEVTIHVTANSSLTVTEMKMYYQLDNNNSHAVTIL